MRTINLTFHNSKIMLIEFKPYSSDPHIHSHGDEYQISIPLLDHSLVELDTAIHNMNVNQRLVTAPGQLHRHFTSAKEGRILLINLKSAFLQDVFYHKTGSHIKELDLSTWGKGTSEHFKKLSDLLIKQIITGIPNQNEIAELEISLAELLLSTHEGNHSEYWRKQVLLKQNPILNRAIEYIQEHFKQELTLDDVAESIGISKFHLVRLFNEQLGTTPSQYINHIRLVYAEEQVRNSSMNITTLAYEAGFGSLATFERLFKKKYGLSAKQYRSQI